VITKQIAQTHRGELWHMSAKNADGTPVRCRITGLCQTWITRPGDFKLPVKHGLRQSFYITPSNAAEWCTPELWPAESELHRA